MVIWASSCLPPDARRRPLRAKEDSPQGRELRLWPHASEHGDLKYAAVLYLVCYDCIQCAYNDSKLWAHAIVPGLSNLSSFSRQPQAAGE